MAEYDLGRTSLVHIVKAASQFFDEGAVILLRMAGQEVAAGPASLEEVEGTIDEIREGIYALPKCPFAETIASYKAYHSSLPEEMYSLADYANRQGLAWVSAFCGIHQSFRRARFGDSYQQIACRSGDKVSIAEQDILSEDEARQILETTACIYAR